MAPRTQRITFTSRGKKGPENWLGVRLERATGSYLENCDFKYGEYGLHIHFVPMRITGCRFLQNDIGIRFHDLSTTQSSLEEIFVDLVKKSA